MEERIYLIDLYDTYGELLSDKKREYFEYYYFDNLSLGEISENLGLSRNAIHKQLKVVEKELREYEEKLKLNYKNKKIENIISKIEDKQIKQELEKIRW